MSKLPHELPFVLDVPATGIAVAHAGPTDLYRPAGASTPLPAVVFIHGPVPEEAPVRPRDWPVYQGYARLAASQGLLGITLDLRYPVWRHGRSPPTSCSSSSTGSAPAPRSTPTASPSGPSPAAPSCSPPGSPTHRVGSVASPSPTRSS
jgi:hypothetical protein